MSPAEVRACTARELHHYLQAWAKTVEDEETEWVD